MILVILIHMIFVIGVNHLCNVQRELTLAVLKESRWVVLFPLKGGEGSKGFLADNPPAPQLALARLIPNHLLMILTSSGWPGEGVQDSPRHTLAK